VVLISVIPPLNTNITSIPALFLNGSNITIQLEDSVRVGKREENMVNRLILILDRALTDVRLNIRVNKKRGQPKPKQRIPMVARATKTNACPVHSTATNPRMSLQEWVTARAQCPRPQQESRRPHRNWRAAQVQTYLVAEQIRCAIIF
jgi:hypothetical protein